MPNWEDIVIKTELSECQTTFRFAEDKVQVLHRPGIGDVGHDELQAVQEMLQNFNDSASVKNKDPLDWLKSMFRAAAVDHTFEERTITVKCDKCWMKIAGKFLLRQ